MIEPYQGKLVNQMLSRDKVEAILSQNLKRIQITEDVVLEIENIAFGVYSPLTGFPSLKDIDSILEKWRLSNDVVFPIPILCHIAESDFNKISNEKIILEFKGEPIALIEVQEKASLDKQGFIETIFRTKNPEHPGVDYINSINNFIITGPILKLKESNYFFTNNSLTPEQSRDEFKKRNWQSISAFSTANIPHSAHEYLQRIILETHDGLFIHALNVLNKSKYSQEEIR